ncbi:hypothetical protein CVT26_015899 [Gymnopilus dilepis]|uniref:Uncharacterized protein n=1 Tax=Gymnopilus dilepis TaxID=231916 RepID=A0A409WHK6_9AGAR|nr:hypothetical protein CVT26_015899 [Gymnopilus dilepis]
MKFKYSLALVLSFITASFASTVAEVEADLQTISTQTSALDNAITSFPNTGGSLLMALDIHSDAVELGSSIDQGTEDTNGVPTKPFSNTDANVILLAVENIQPVILDTLTDIVAKKPAFAGLPIGGVTALILQDLQNLNASTSNLESALISATPTSLLPVASSIKSTIDAAFVTAIAAYTALDTPNHGNTAGQFTNGNTRRGKPPNPPNQPDSALAASLSPPLPDITHVFSSTYEMQGHFRRVAKAFGKTDVTLR